MKNMIQNITGYIRPPLLLLLTLFIAGNVTGQAEQPLSDKSKKFAGDAWHAAGVESQSKAYIMNACGSYPASGTWLQSISVLTAAKECTTTITPGPGTVYFRARDKVILYAGFTALNGSNFVAYLESKEDTVTRSALAAEKLDEANETVSIAPNPFSGSFIMSVNSAKDVKAQVIIYNSVGVKMKEQTGITVSQGVNKMFFDCSNFASGIYTVEIELGDSKIIRKVIKT